MKYRDDHFSGQLKDLRLSKRGELILKGMIETGSAVPHRLSHQHKERIGMSRFFHNTRASVEDIRRAICCSWYGEAYKTEDLYLIQDTSGYNAIKHRGRLKEDDPDLGPIWNATTLSEYGFFMHPCLVVGAASNFPLGYAHIHLWNRRLGEPGRMERNYKRQPIKEKSSYRWIEGMELSRDILSGHEGQRYHIMDREADIYELFVRPLAENEHLIIRANRNRSIYNQEGKKQNLWPYLESQSPKAVVEIALPRQGKRLARKAKFSLYYERVSIARPKDRTKAQGPDKLPLTLVQLKELPETVPAGEQPVHWCLWTDLEVSNTEQALKCIQAYKSRWIVEELFSLVKTKGLDTEASQLESGIALKKLVLLALQAALYILQLIKDRDNDYKQPITTILGQEDIVFLDALIRSLEGKTEKQQNPHPPDSLARLAWAVARLGGWSGYSSQSPPGPKTMRWGWQRFLNALQGWHLAAKTDSS